jgi:transcriptional regulator with XRE-family HTH domain
VAKMAPLAKKDGRSTDEQRRAHVAEKLHTLSLKNGWRQADVCRATGLGRDSVSRYFQGATLPEALAISKLAQAFNVAPTDIDPEAGFTRITPIAPARQVEVTLDPARKGYAMLRIDQPVRLGTIGRIIQMIEDDEKADGSAATT